MNLGWVFVCVCVRERERERELKTPLKKRHKKVYNPNSRPISIFSTQFSFSSFSSKMTKTHQES